MTGRKRKAAVRTPSGQISRAGQEERSFAPTAIKRLAEQAIAAASDPRLGSEVGRLLLAGDLTARQAGAAWRYAEISAKASKARQSPQCKTARLERGQRGHDADSETERGQAIERALVIAVRRHERARAVVIGHGVEALRDVEALACADRALMGYERLVRVRAALDALASHFATS